MPHLAADGRVRVGERLVVGPRDRLLHHRGTTGQHLAIGVVHLCWRGRGLGQGLVVGRGGGLATGDRGGTGQGLIVLGRGGGGEGEMGVA